MTFTSKSEKKIYNLKLARVSTVAFFIDTQLYSQISKTVEEGIEVTVVTSDHKLNRPIDAVSHVSIEIPRQVSLLKDISALFKLYNLFRDEKFDIVHSTTPKAGFLCALAGWLAGVPIRVHSYTGQPWVTLKGFKRFLAKVGDKVIGKFTTSCYADSHSQESFLVSQKIVPQNKLSVLGCGSLSGVDINRFNPESFTHQDKKSLMQKCSIPNKGLVFLFVGRIVKDKGIFELVEAFRALLASDNYAHLLMVGPQELTKEELGIIPGSDIDKKIVFTGYTDTPENYMAISDVLCIPSYREGFGTVVIEAASMGVPAIGTSIYGLSDAILDQETGLLIPVKDSGALLDAMLRFYDGDFRDRLGIAARDRAITYFSSETMNTLVINEYYRLTAKIIKVHNGK